MASVNFLISADITSSDGASHTVGSATSKVKVSVTGSIEERIRSLAANAIWTPWDELSSTLADFQVLIIVADADVEIELSVDRDGANERVFIVRASANVPFILSSGKSRNGYVKNWAAGTEDNIDRIRIKNISTSTAIVRFMIVK
ncbi:MAG: hypothetical protein KatS3mg087_1129 [Patescibacteria group bacterium]|nr:MAG: hypothetical protein KatS3mg087_1129 [Patescibacteria group bacterium]